MRRRYIEHLPAMYQGDDFLGRFLAIFEDVLSPVDQVLQHIHLYFDPMVAPESFLPWLASWIDLALDENWAIRKRRELIKAGVELYHWRGTRRGLREYLRIYTDVEPEIIEHFTEEEGGPHRFTVVISIQDPTSLDGRRVRQVIDSEKPAHTTYELRIESTD